MGSLKDFDILTKLGEGSFGQVFKVKRKADKSIYVMKQINISKMSQRMKNEALNEATILSKLNSQYIVRYFDSFIDKSTLCIIMEYCEQGDLHSFLKGQLGRPLAENTIWKFLVQMVIGLSYLHKQKILHRDIKSMNIFLCPGSQIRIGDLGVAKVLSDQNNFARTMVGTPYYLSPEMCEEKPYNEKSDIWALGCVLYELCTFKHPFEATNQGALVLKIIRGRYDPISTKLYSPALVQLVDSCLQKDLSSRPTAHDLLQQKNLIQMAKQLDINVSINIPHPSSIQYKQSQQAVVQPVQTPIPTTKQPEILKQQPQPLPQALQIKGTAQVLQAVQKPSVVQQPKERYQAETPQPIKKELNSPAPKVIIKSTAFNAKQIQAAYQPSQQPSQQVLPQPLQKPDPTPTPIIQKKMIDPTPISQKKQISVVPITQQPVNQVAPQQPLTSQEYQNMYKEWKAKVEEIHQSVEIPVQVIKSDNKPTPSPIVNKSPAPQSQAIPPSKKPIQGRIQSAQQPKQVEKKRVRKGAPQEPSKKVLNIKQSSDLEEAKDKLRLLKSKKQKPISDEQIEVMNLPDYVPKPGPQIPIQAYQSEVVDIDEFFNEHIQKIRQDRQVTTDCNRTVKPNQRESAPSSEEEQIIIEEEDLIQIPSDDVPVEDEQLQQYDDPFEPEINEPDETNASEQPKQQEYLEYEEEETYHSYVAAQQKYGEIPFVEVKEEYEGEGEELIQFEEQDESDQHSDQEAYYEEEENNDDTVDYNDHNEQEQAEWNQFVTIKEDPFEYTEVQAVDREKQRLQDQLQQAKKRQAELKMLMAAKEKQCIRELGQKKTEELVAFLRDKLHSEVELTDDEQEEMTIVVQEKYFKDKDPQILYTFYQILHLEYELSKTSGQIEQLEQQ